MSENHVHRPIIYMGMVGIGAKLVVLHVCQTTEIRNGSVSRRYSMWTTTGMQKRQKFYSILYSIKNYLINSHLISWTLLSRIRLQSARCMLNSSWRERYKHCFVIVVTTQCQSRPIVVDTDRKNSQKPNWLRTDNVTHTHSHTHTYARGTHTEVRVHIIGMLCQNIYCDKWNVTVKEKTYHRSDSKLEWKLKNVPNSVLIDWFLVSKNSF